MNITSVILKDALLLVFWLNTAIPAVAIFGYLAVKSICSAYASITFLWANTFWADWPVREFAERRVEELHLCVVKDMCPHKGNKVHLFVDRAQLKTISMFGKNTAVVIVSDLVFVWLERMFTTGSIRGALVVLWEGLIPIESY